MTYSLIHFGMFALGWFKTGKWEEINWVIIIILTLIIDLLRELDALLDVKFQLTWSSFLYLMLILHWSVLAPGQHGHLLHCAQFYKIITQKKLIFSDSICLTRLENVRVRCLSISTFLGFCPPVNSQSNQR